MNWWRWRFRWWRRFADAHGDTLFTHAGFRFALYPRRGGRWPDLDNPDNLEWLGRYLGRIHAVGGIKPFIHRPTLDTDSLGTQSYRYLLEGGFIPTHIELAYRTLAEDLLTAGRRRVSARRRCRPHPSAR